MTEKKSEEIELKGFKEFLNVKLEGVLMEFKKNTKDLKFKDPAVQEELKGFKNLVEISIQNILHEHTVVSFPRHVQMRFVNAPWIKPGEAIIMFYDGSDDKRREEETS